AAAEDAVAIIEDAGLARCHALQRLLGHDARTTVAEMQDTRRRRRRGGADLDHDAVTRSVRQRLRITQPVEFADRKAVAGECRAWAHDDAARLGIEPDDVERLRVSRAG